MAEYNVEAIVVRVKAFGEADRLVHLLTREAGKLRVVARGARRPKSRFTPAMQLFTHCQVQCYRGRTLDGVRQVQILESFRALREDLERMAHATYACEMADELVLERQPAEAVFSLLLELLRTLASPDSVPGPALAAFQLQLLALSGFRPELGQCVACGSPVTGAHVRLSPAEGGILCERCAAGAGPVLRVARGALEAMRFLQGAGVGRAGVLRLQEGLWEQVRRAIEEFVEFRLERRLRSRAFLDPGWRS
ncbi:DNA repair protein RecO [Caldinitratiruptor microaerophilus]|uniref:DNA repair protein RecO n=1 Tax=Caldinitratiruptor microaerophilus TaxID=671077 RepID=A0AA35G8U2_9FIRM|nr:DNA repair protein RecO [Caldinitratiruptor microaerophilus]BDG61400.1 DNA repair protein RecO [Caldinitratiruptor microaerophilus]